MIIPEKFAQFNKENALLLISGKQEMVIYVLKDGEIHEERRFVIPNDTYSDNEGHFKVRSGGKVIRSGSVREIDDRKIIDKFKSEIVSALGEVSTDFDQVFLSAPGKTKNEILGLLSPEMSEKVTKTVEGNYCSLPAVDILSVFSDGEDSKNTLSNADARKILAKDNQR